MELALIGSLLGAGYLLNKDGKKTRPDSREIREYINPDELPSGNNIYDSSYFMDAQKINNNLNMKRYELSQNPNQNNIINKNYRLEKDSQYLQRMVGSSPEVFQRWQDSEALPRGPYSKYKEPIKQSEPISYGEVGTANYSLLDSPSPAGNGLMASNENHISSFASKKIQENFVNPSNDTLPMDDNQIMSGRQRYTEGPNDDKRFYHNNMVPYYRGHYKQNADSKVTEGILQRYTGNFDEPVGRKQEIAPMFAPSPNMGNVYGDTATLEQRDLSKYIPSMYRQSELPVEQIKVGRGLNAGYTAEGSGGFHDYTRIMPKTTDEIRAQNKPKETYKARVLSGKALNEKQTLQMPVAKNRPEKFLENKEGERNFGPTKLVKEELKRAPVIVKNTSRKESMQVVGTASSQGNKQTYTKAATQESKRQNFSLDGLQTNVINLVKKLIGRYDDDAKETKKQNTINNDNQVGNSKMKGINNHTQYFTDIAKTTIKETNIHDGGYHQVSMPTKKRIVYDPNEQSKETRKQNTIRNADADGAIKGPSKQYVYDPEDIARTTIKEMFVDETTVLNANGSKKQIVYDPEDIARTTIKEMYVDETTVLNANGNKKRIVYDPNDVARTTIKEMVIDNKYVAPGDAAVKQSMSYADIYNAQISDDREIVAQGREPTQNNVKVALGKDGVNTQVKRNDELDENKRGFVQDTPNGDRLSQITPDASYMRSTETKDKSRVQDEVIANRLDGDLLKAFKENPYTKPLDSY